MYVEYSRVEYRSVSECTISRLRTRPAPCLLDWTRTMSQPLARTTNVQADANIQRPTNQPTLGPIHQVSSAEKSHSSSTAKSLCKVDRVNPSWIRIPYTTASSPPCRTSSAQWAAQPGPRNRPPFPLPNSPTSNTEATLHNIHNRA